MATLEKGKHTYTLLVFLFPLVQSTSGFFRTLTLTNTTVTPTTRNLISLLSASDLLLDRYFLPDKLHSTNDSHFYSITALRAISYCHHHSYEDFNFNYSSSNGYVKHVEDTHLVFLKKEGNGKEDKDVFSIIGILKEPAYGYHALIFQYYSACWETTLNLTSSSMVYKEVKGQVTEYQVAPGAKVNISCYSDRIEKYLPFSGYNLTLKFSQIEPSTNGEEEEEILTSRIGLSVSHWWAATRTPSKISCDVMWRGETKILASNSITVRPIDTNKEPTLTLTSPFPTNATCSSSSSYVASFTFWDHPGSLFTWTHPNGTSRNGSCAELSGDSTQCQSKVLSLGVREDFGVADVGMYTLSLITPGYPPLNVSTTFSPKCLPQNTSILIEGMTENYVLVNTTFRAFCSAWGNPLPSLTLTAWPDDTNILQGETMAETLLPAHIEKVWEVYASSPAPLINFTCTAFYDEQEDMKSVQVYISDASSLKEHETEVPMDHIEGDNVTLPCHQSVAMMTAQSPLKWTKVDQENVNIPGKSHESPYLDTLSLFFSPVRLADEGRYTCQVEQQVIRVINLQVTGCDPAQKVYYTPAEEAVLNFIPEDAIAGIPGIPQPDEEALTEEVAGPAPAGDEGQQLREQFEETGVAGPSSAPLTRHLHVQFEETGDMDLTSQSVFLEEVDASQSPGSPGEEEWQQVQPGVYEIAQDLDVALADHSYLSLQEPTASTSTRPVSPTHTSSRPVSRASSRPSSRQSSRPPSPSSAHEQSRQGKGMGMLKEMLAVQTNIHSELKELNSNFRELIGVIRGTTKQ